MASTGQLLCDGEFEIIWITEGERDEAWQLFEANFLPNENFSIGCDLWLNADAIPEIHCLFNNIVADGISFAARHVKSQRLAAIACNKILNPSTNCSVDELFNTFRSSSMLNVGEMLGSMETTVNLHELWGIDCVMELFFLATSVDFGRKGLALSLAQHSIAFGRQLKEGSVSESILRRLPEHVRREKPKAVTAVFSSLYTQRIGRKLHFDIIYQKPYTEFMYKGRCYAQVVDPKHAVCTYEAYKL